MAKDKVVNVPNVGPVAFPSSMGWDEIEKNVRLIAIQSGATDVAAPKRTWGEAAADIGLNLGQGIGSMILQPLGTAAGYYPGADNFLTRAAQGLSYGQEQYQSDAQRLSQMAAQNRINQAEKESGQFMAGLQAVKEYVTNPVLAGKFVTEQLPQFGMMAATGGASRALSGLAGLSEVAAGRAALGTAIGTGAAMNAADVSSSTYNAVMGLDARGLQEMQRDPDFQQYLVQTGDIGKAQQLYAENHARKAGGAAFGITLATSAVPGAQSVERFLAGQTGKNLAAKEAEQLAKSGFLKGVGKGMLGEAGQEVAEEGGGQYLQNIYTPGAESMAGVGQAAGLGALGGALFGGVTGGVEGAAQKAEYNRRQALLDQFKQDVSSALRETEKPAPVADGILPPEVVPTVPSPVQAPAQAEPVQQPAAVTTPEEQAVQQPEQVPVAPARPPGPVSIQTLAQEMAIAEKTGNVADMDRILGEYRKLKEAAPQDISTEPISEEEVMTQPQTKPEAVETAEPTVSPSERIYGVSTTGTAVGWDMEGSKPFTTQKAAKAALEQAIEDGTLDKTYRPVAVSKGKFYLSPMTPAEIKAAQIAADEKASKQFAKAKPIPAHEYIAGLGGIDPSMRSDTRIEGNAKAGKGWLFAGAKSGKGLNGDQLAEALYQGGYTPTELDGYEALDFVMKSAEGDPQYKLEEVGSTAEEEMRQRMADAYTREQESQETPEEVAARKADEEDEFFREYLNISPPVISEKTRKSPSYKRQSARLIKDYEKGKLESEAALGLMRLALNSSKKETKSKDRVRGADFIRQRLLEEKRKGTITEDAADLAEWFIQKNPALFADLGISIKSSTEENKGESGSYDALERIINLIKDTNSDLTATHELLHHLERMMPEKAQQEIQKAWFNNLKKAAFKAEKGSDENLKNYFKNLIMFHLMDDLDARKSALQLLKDGLVGYDNYQYFNPSEYWAVNASQILHNDKNLGSGVVPQIKRWLNEFKNWVMSKFGLKSDTPLLRGIEAVISGEGKFISPMLSQGVVFNNIEPQLSSSPPVAVTQIATAQQVNQMTKAPTTTGSAEEWDSLVQGVPTFQDAAQKLKQFVKNIPEDKRTQFFKVLTMRQLADFGKSSLPGMKDYMDIVNEMAGDRDTRLFKAGEIADKWAEMRRKDPNNYIKCSDVMHESTIAKFDPAKYKEGDQLTIDGKRILDAYESLPQNWKDLYKQVRDYYADRGKEYQALVESRIDQAITDKKHALGVKLILKQRFEQMMKQGPYFPLSRFGNYSAYFEVNGEPHYYLFQFASELKDFERKNPGIKMQTGVKVNDLLGTKAGSGDTFVNEVFKQIDALSQGQGGLDLDNRKSVDELKDAIWQLNLLSKPEVSMSRNFIHRNNIKGYDNDALRSFADNTFHASYQLAKLKFQGDLQSKMNDMQRTVADMRRNSDPEAVKAGEYLNELSERRDWIMNPADSNMLTEKASQFGFLYFLASPASALVNLSQNAVIAYPTLGARFGFGRSFEAMSSASKEFFKSGDRSKFMTHEGLFNITRSLLGNEKAAMERLIEIGTLTRTNTYDLVGLADKPSAEYGTAAQTANKWISGLFHSAEVFNRSTTALASYRLEVSRLKAQRNQGKNKLTDKEIHEQGIKTANDLTIESHFDYSGANKPPVMQGPTARIILMYKQYAQHMTYLLANSTRLYMDYLKNKFKGTPMEAEAIEIALEAKRKLTGILGMTALLGGLTSMPLWWVVSGVMNAIMGDPDDPYDFDQEFTAALAENLNPTLAKAIMKGSPELLQGAGIAAPDLSGRISLNGLWFRDDGKNVDREEATRNFVVQMGGPYAGLAVNFAAGLKLIEEGNTWRGMEKMLPSVIANGLKGIRYEFEGANTLRGDPLLGEVTHAEAALQALGFTPSRLARIYEINSAQKNFEKSVTDRRNLILHKMYLAMMNGDDDAYDNIGDMIVNFNERHPEYPITQETIQRSIRGNQQKAAEAEHGVVLNKKLSGKTRPMAEILED